MDFASSDGPITPQHYAFLITEAEFNAVLERIKAQAWTIGPTRHADECGRSIAMTADAAYIFRTPTVMVSK